MNEAVRKKENTERLEWIQNHVQCDGPAEVLGLMKTVFFWLFFYVYKYRINSIVIFKMLSEKFVVLPDFRSYLKASFHL